MGANEISNSFIYIYAVKYIITFSTPRVFSLRVGRRSREVQGSSNAINHIDVIHTNTITANGQTDAKNEEEKATIRDDLILKEALAIGGRGVVGEVVRVGMVSDRGIGNGRMRKCY